MTVATSSLNSTATLCFSQKLFLALPFSFLSHQMKRHSGAGMHMCIPQHSQKKRQEDDKFEVSLGYPERLCQKELEESSCLGLSFLSLLALWKVTVLHLPVSTPPRPSIPHAHVCHLGHVLLCSSDTLDILHPISLYENNALNSSPDTI